MADLEKKEKVKLLLQRTERDLKDLEKFIKEFFIFLPLPVCTVNPLGIIVDINQAFCDLTGYSRGEIVGEEANLLFLDKKEFKALEEKIFKEKLVKGKEMILASKTKEKIPVNISGSIRENGERNLIGYFLALFDISELKRYQSELEIRVEERTRELTRANEELRIEVTERKRVEEELLHEGELLYTLMNNIPDSIYFKDSKSRFIRINEAQAKTLGISNPHQAIGKTDFDFFAEEHAKEAYEDEQEIIKIGRPLIGKIEQDIRLDGWTRWVSTTKVPIVDKEGRVNRIVGISRDITERHKLTSELKSKVAQLETLHHTLREIATSLDLGEVLSLIVEESGALLGAEGVLLRLLDREGQLRLIKSKGYRSKEKYPRGGIIKLGQGVSSQIVQKGEPVAIEDIKECPAYLYKDYDTKEGFISYLGVPLESKERTIGIMALLTKKRRSFTEDEISLLETFAHQASVAIENAKLVGDLRRQINLMKAISQTTRKVATSLKLKSVLDSILRNSALLFEADAARIRLLDPEKKIFKTSQTYNLDPTELADIKLGEGLTSETVFKRKPIVVDDIAKEPRYLYKKWALEKGYSSALLVPLQGKKGVIGVLSILSKKVRRFDKQEISLASIFAGEAAVAIENAQLYEKVEERTKALTESEERFSQLYDEAPVGYHEIDVEGRITRVNRSELNMLGYTAEEMLGRHVWDFIVEKGTSSQAFAAKIAGAIPPGRAFGRTYRRKDGTPFPVLIEDRLLRDERGRIIGLRSTIQDITERKKAEAKLKQILAELEHSNAELEQFAYVTSHDLQEPLRMVSSYVELLKRRYKGRLDSDADEFIAYAVDGATRMQKMINDLLDYSRVSTRGKLFEPTNCEAVLERTLANLRIAIEESGAVVTHDPLPTVMADDGQLVQLFQNLIGNAIKFRSKEPPHIYVSAEQKGNKWVFSVRDNGISIDPEYAERIFQIFQRLHSRTEYPGTGIGLAICKRIVERHEGRIWVKSQPGEGSTFYFTIPVKE